MRMPRPSHTLVLLSIAACVASGCKTAQLYDGARLSREEVAHISGDIPLTMAPLAVVLRQVDGRDLSVNEHAVDVLPGTHRLLVDCRIRETNSTTRHTLEVEVEAGERYRLEAETSPGMRGCAEVRLARSPW